MTGHPASSPPPPCPPPRPSIIPSSSSRTDCFKEDFSAGRTQPFPQQQLSTATTEQKAALQQQKKQQLATDQAKLLQAKVEQAEQQAQEAAM
jgi:hypothetical protein